MDFKDYLDIIGAEGLEESPLADGLLIEAMQLERQIKVLNKHEDTDEIVNKLNERKLVNIWTAIDLARMYKEDEELSLFIKKEFQKSNGREFKGFIHEFRLMKESN